MDQYAKLDPQDASKSYLYDAFQELFEKEIEMEKLYEKVVTADEKDHEKTIDVGYSDW